MNDFFLARYSELEHSAHNLRRLDEELHEALEAVYQRAQSLYGNSFRGSAADAFVLRHEDASRQAQTLRTDLGRMAANLQTVAEKCRQCEAEIIALFDATPAQRIAATLGISLANVDGSYDARGYVLGASTDFLNGVDLDPKHYPYDYHRRVIQRINELFAPIRLLDEQIAGMRRAKQDDLRVIAELEQRLSSPTVLIDKLLGTEETYRAVLEQTQQRLSTWDGIIERLEQRRAAAMPDIQIAVQHELDFLALPGDPDTWLPIQDYTTKQLNEKRDLLAGCTAYVAERIYIPFSYPEPELPSAGMASDWVGNARYFMSQSGNERYGVSVDSTPRVGAIVAWNDLNHVGIVVAQDANDPNRILVGQADTYKNEQGVYDQPWGTYINPREAWETIDNKTFIHLPWSEYQLSQ